MRISELTQKLEQLKEEHGDKRVFTYGWDEEDGTFIQELKDDSVKPIEYMVGNDTGVYGIGIDN